MYQMSQELTASLYEKRGQLCTKGTAQGQNLGDLLQCNEKAMRIRRF